MYLEICISKRDAVPYPYPPDFISFNGTDNTLCHVFPIQTRFQRDGDVMTLVHLLYIRG